MTFCHDLVKVQYVCVEEIRESQRTTCIFCKGMAKYTKKEFAERCGMKTNMLAVYISPKHSKVIVGEDGFIDSENPINAHFLQKRIAKGKVKQKPLQSRQVSDFDDDDELSDPDSDIPTYEESERRVKYFDALKREKEVEKLNLDIQKKRGEVIPFELITPVLIQHNQSILTAYKNEFDEWLRNVAKRYGFTNTDLADARGQAATWMNDAMNKATDMSVSAIDGIVDDYAEKRGVGERITV